MSYLLLLYTSCHHGRQLKFQMHLATLLLGFLSARTAPTVVLLAALTAFLAPGAIGIAQPWTGRIKALLGAKWAISLDFYMNGHRNQSCHLVRPPFQMFMAIFCAGMGWHCLREYSLVNRHGRFANVLRMADSTYVCVHFGDIKNQDVGYVLSYPQK